MHDGNPTGSKAPKPSTTELNDRQRRFADRIVDGDAATAAYFKAFPRCKSKSTAAQEGCKLLKNPKVAAFIQELREWDEDVMQSERIITKQELLEFLTRTIRTAAGAIDRDDPLCQSYKDTVGQYSSTHEIKLPDKLKAAERVCKIMGWDAPEKIEDATAPKPPTEEELAAARETLKKWTTFAPKA
jgi:phage terminase small subunit